MPPSSESQKLHSPSNVLPSNFDGRSLQTYGNSNLLHSSTRRMLLISRGERYPDPTTPWFCKLLEATLLSIHKDETLIIGTDRLPFDAARKLCRKRSGKMIVVLDRSIQPSDKEMVDKVGSSCLMVSCETIELTKRQDRKGAMKRRDLLITYLSNAAWKIQIRPKGHMAESAKVLLERKGIVEEPPGKEETTKRPIKKSPEVDWKSLQLNLPKRKEWLVHYTRKPTGPWPNETYDEFLSWLIGACNPRTDLDSLNRILTTGRIFPSGRLIFKKTPMVSFTEADPGSLADSVSWRTGLNRWTFRPYGIALLKDVLVKKYGAKPVSYVEKDNLKILTEGQRIFAQPKDWKAEKEWRVQREIALSDFYSSGVIPLIHLAEEKTLLPNSYQSSTISFLKRPHKD